MKAYVNGTYTPAKAGKVTIPAGSQVQIRVSSNAGYELTSLTMERPDGATTTASVFIYKQAFKGKQLFAKAAAASMILFVIICILSAILFWIMRDKDAIAAEKLRKEERKRRKQQQIGEV